MENFLNGGIAELEEAKKAIIDEAEKHQAVVDAENDIKSKEKELNAQKMFMSDKIESTIKNRRNDIERSHDSTIKEADRDVKEARKNKKEALNKAVNERVKNETSDLAAENKRLKKESKALFKENKMPGFCTSNYYYAMFAPKGGKDFLVFALTIVIAIALIPNVVCWFLDWEMIYKILIYVGIVVFFALIYFLISVWTRSGAKADVLEKARPNKDAIRDNKKSIKKMSKVIKKDDNEGQYGLEDFDSEIIRRQGIYSDKFAAKESALQEFDEVTASHLKDEIEKEMLPGIEKLTQDIENLKAELVEKKQAAQDAGDTLTANYLGYLGEKYTTPEKIDELIAIINEGKAATIMQAMDVSKGGVE